jgi:manganese/zinc/iron transport system substrate-binding protein
MLLVTMPAQAQQAIGCETPTLNVVATVGMIADVARNIGEACVTVTGMMGPGVDPHLYAATERDVETLFEADLILYGGLHLEARMIDVFGQIAEGLGTPVYAVSERIPEDLRLTDPTYDQPDPHVWMDVSLWMYAAEAIRDALIEQDERNAAYYSANADTYLAELNALHEYVKSQIARIPEERRVLVTAHDAFQYFSRAYEIAVHAPQGITTQSEVGVADIRATIALLVERQIPAIFVETSVSPDVIEAILEGAEAQGHRVVIGGSLYSDAMGDEGTPEGTYLGMIRANTDTIVSGLLSEPGD